MRSFFPPAAACGLALFAGCAPEPAPDRSREGADAPAALAAPPAESDPLRRRLGHALEIVKRRPVLTTHSFWSIFHAILGAGPDLKLSDPATGKQYVAMDYLLLGGKPRGFGFVATSFGIDVPTVGSAPGYWEHEGQGHQDQFLAEMIQQGLAPDRKVLVDGKEYKALDLTRASQGRARLNAGQELGWAIVAIGQHFGTDCEWTNQHGEKLRYEQLVEAEAKAPIDNQQACGATHRLFGLAWAYHLHRANCAKKGTAPGPLWEVVRRRLDEHVALAKRFQNPDGTFSSKYSMGPGRPANPDEALASSGHILEWLVQYVPESELREPWLTSAGEAVAKLIVERPAEPYLFGALYHAAHGLGVYHARLAPKAPPKP